MGVLTVMRAGRLGSEGGEGESSVRFGKIGGNGSERNEGLGMREGRTKVAT